LDQDTTGLLLLTNDGDLHQYLSHPRNRIPKDYEAVIEGRMASDQIQKLGRGIYIGDKEYGKASIVSQETTKGRSVVILRLYQGKKREIRRIMHRLNLKLISLKRIRFAGLELGDLPEHHYRTLSEMEVKLLHK
jgi:pseudouridine synthase